MIRNNYVDRGRCYLPWSLRSSDDSFPLPPPPPPPPQSEHLLLRLNIILILLLTLTCVQPTSC